MNAGNWTYCQKCKVEFDKRVEAIKAKADLSYGKVTASEYLALRAEAEKSHEQKQTLREDWGIVITAREFEISYSAGCGVCGFSYSFSKKRELDLSEVPVPPVSVPAPPRRRK